MTATTTTRLDLDFVVMTADFVVWSKILVEVTVNRVCTTAWRIMIIWKRIHKLRFCIVYH